MHNAGMLNAHPLVVHYPIALLTAALVFEVLWLIFRREPLYHATTATLVLGAALGVAAVITGLIAGDTVPHPEPAHDIMETHETIALISFALAAILSVWRLWRLRRPCRTSASVFFAFFLLATAGLISYAAHLGGTMVYKYGVGATAVKMPAESGHHHHEGEAHEEGEPEHHP